MATEVALASGHKRNAAEGAKSLREWVQHGNLCFQGVHIGNQNGIQAIGK